MQTVCLNCYGYISEFDLICPNCKKQINKYNHVAYIKYLKDWQLPEANLSINSSFINPSNINPYAEPIKISENLSEHIASLRKKMSQLDIAYNKDETLFEFFKKVFLHIDNYLRKLSVEKNSNWYILMSEVTLNQLIDSIPFIDDESKDHLKNNKQVSVNGELNNITIIDDLESIYIIIGRKGETYNLFNFKYKPLFYIARIRLE